jgi:probable phosphoglycerate mutase
MPKTSLKNQYFAMRHGQSEANVAGIIVSDPRIGCKQYGLTEHGQQQVIESASNTRELKQDTLIISSDFLRAQNTAEFTQKILNTTHPIQYSTALRERFFGELNGQDDTQYQMVWDIDQQNPDHQDFGVESANQVVLRTSALIKQLEEQSFNGQDNTGKNILLVAHGDVLQLLQTWFQDVPASQHRSLLHLETAEIRCLNPG